MFYVRITFTVNQNYEFDLDDDILFKKNHYVCKVKIESREKFDEPLIVVTYGAFESYDLAKSEGESLYTSLKRKFIKLGIPINISGGLGVLDTTQTFFSTGGLTEHGLENIDLLFPQLKGKCVRNSVLGLAIYELDMDISEVTFVMQGIEIKQRLDFPKIEVHSYEEDIKLEVIYSLLNSSNNINDLRTRFLLIVSAVESFVSEEELHDVEYIDIIKQINRLAKSEKISNKFNLSDDQFQSLLQKVKSNIGLLSKKSISQKCIDLITSYIPNRMYLNLEAAMFFKKCYALRSEFVHTGTFQVDLNEEQKIRMLEEYTFELNKLVLDLIESYELRNGKSI